MELTQGCRGAQERAWEPGGQRGWLGTPDWVWGSGGGLGSGLGEERGPVP